MQDGSRIDADSWQELAPSDVAAVRQWFVESQGSYVGPMEIGELERLWRTAEINALTRVWTEGMAEWQPLGDVPDLLYLAGEKVDASAASSEPEWLPTEALSLMDLADAELVAMPASKPAQASTATLYDLPTLQGSTGPDPFARWWTERRLAVPEPTPWPTDPWARVSARPSRRPWRWAAGIAVVVLVAAGAALATPAVRAFVWPSTKHEDSTARAAEALPEPPLAAVHPVGTSSPGQPAAHASSSSDAAGPEQIPTTPDAADAKAESAEASPAATAGRRETPVTGSEPPEAESSARKTAAERRAAARARREALAAREERPAAPSAATSSTPAPADPKPAASGPAPAAKLDALTPQEVIAATRGQVQNLAPCVKTARATGDLAPQRYTFILDWKVRPDGSVELATVKGPRELVGTAVARCFEQAVRSWRYRPSSEPFEVENFPLPVTVH